MNCSYPELVLHIFSVALVKCYKEFKENLFTLTYDSFMKLKTTKSQLLFCGNL